MSDFETVPVGTMEELKRVKEERDGWIESAHHFASGQEFYHGIVRQIGEVFGEEARTSDDGSVQDDVLALKVPELVEALAAHVELVSRRAEECANELASMIDRYNVQSMEDGSWSYDHQTPWELMAVVKSSPKLSLDRLIAEKQADILEEATAHFRAKMADPNLLCMIDATFLEMRANELRREAGGELT